MAPCQKWYDICEGIDIPGRACYKNLKICTILRNSMNNKGLADFCDETGGGSKEVVAPVVMVVENDSDTMVLICELLRSMGRSVLAASNGREALNLLGKNIPEVIFMDIHMPIMDGFDTTRHIRQMPDPYRSIPIIALVADAIKGDHKKCREAGMNDYISKPLRLDEIQEKLQIQPG